MAAARRPAHNDDDKAPPFRCLDLARLVTAAAMTVLIVAVTAYAVTVVLRPGKLSLWIVGGSVSVSVNSSSNNNGSSRSTSQQLTSSTPPAPYNASTDALVFRFALRASNPSGRVRIYYTGVVAALRARNSSADANVFLKMQLKDVAVPPTTTVDSDVLSVAPLRAPFQEEYFERLGNGSSVGATLMVLNGTRTVENYSGHNITGVTAVYYCWPLDVAGDLEQQSGLDVSCKEDPPTDI